MTREILKSAPIKSTHYSREKGVVFFALLLILGFGLVFLRVHP